jgi:hypothetical protein
MKHASKTFLLTFILFLALVNICSAQTAGKIFTREEANKLFGGVIESVKISPAELKSIIAKTDKYVMFRVVNGETTILGDGRKAIYPGADAAVGKIDVYHYYSKSVVLELLSKGNGDMVYLENRKNVFSVTYGTNTMEEGILCPPICVD